MLFEKETYQIIGICMEVHRRLGHGFSEIVYKDALEIEFQARNIEYKREKEYSIEYKGLMLRHKFYADFIVFDKIILEAKAVNGIFSKDDMAQSINYLKVSGCKIGLMINFGQSKLVHQRLIF